MASLTLRNAKLFTSTKLVCIQLRAHPYIVLNPKLIPVMVALGLVQGAEMTQALGLPELAWPFETTLLLPTG
jgi:hypothetical protein